MKIDQLYFRTIDDEFCSPLEVFIADAKHEGLSEITLVKAIPDDETTDFIWCTYHGTCVEICDCKKSQCPDYSSKSGRGRCKHKGNLYLHGEEVKFNIEYPLPTNGINERI